MARKLATVRSANRSDAVTLVVLRSRLWPSASEEEHASDLESYFNGTAREPQEILVAEKSPGSLIGFCELSIRAYAESCSTDNVAYLEGWYISPEFRRSGVGRKLIEAAEEWGRSRGCTEFASDADADNEVSIKAHHALGFDDAGQIRCFRKDL